MHEEFKQDQGSLYYTTFHYSTGLAVSRKSIHSFIYIYLLRVYDVPNRDAGDTAVNKENSSVLAQRLQSN